MSSGLYGRGWWMLSSKLGKCEFPTQPLQFALLNTLQVRGQRVHALFPHRPVQDPLVLAGSCQTAQGRIGCLTMLMAITNCPGLPRTGFQLEYASLKIFDKLDEYSNPLHQTSCRIPQRIRRVRHEPSSHCGLGRSHCE